MEVLGGLRGGRRAEGAEGVGNIGGFSRDFLRERGDWMGGGTPGGEMVSFLCSASKKQEVLSFLRQGFGCGRTGA